MRAPLELCVAIGAAVFAISLAACGGDGGSESTPNSASNGAAAEISPQAGDGNGATEKGAGEEAGKNASGGKESSNSAEGQEPSSTSATYRGPSASSFVPKQHDDSRSGSAQFRQEREEGNSIQDFGDEASGSEFDEVAAAFHNFLDARAEGNWAAMCEYFGSNIIESIEELGAARELQGAECPALIEAFGAYTTVETFGREAEKADVASVRVDGDRAFAIYWGTEGNVNAFPMAREDSGWKVTAIAPMPICVNSLAGNPTAGGSCSNGS